MDQWYYAKNGKQQGPIALSALKGLIASGALDPARDLVWTSTMADWLPASQVPEVMNTPSVSEQGLTETLEQPFAYPTATGALEEIQPGSEPIIPTACMKRAFDLTVKNLGPLVVIMLVLAGISIVSEIVLEVVRVAVVGEAAAAEYGIGAVHSEDSQLSAAQAVVVFVLNVISSLITLFLTLGGLRIGLNAVSGKPFSVGMLFGQGDKLIRAFFAQLLFVIMVIAGLILLIVPGVYLALRYGQFMAAIVDKDLGIMDSFKYSSALTENNKLNLLVIYLLSILVVIAGCLALIVGLLFAYPMMALMWAVAYRWMQYGGRAVLDDPMTQKPMLSELPD